MKARVRRPSGLSVLCAGALAAALAGCAAIGEPRPPGDDALEGRLSVRVEGTTVEPERSLSAAFELRGDAQSGSLNLSTPMGTILAQARWTPQQALLITPQGQTLYADMPALTRGLLGEDLPLVALFDWLRGRPWPGAQSQPTSAPEEAGFLQLGWQVTLARFDQGFIVARRAQPPTVTVRARVERP